ncbi:hypothetical protein [Polymorphospora sp. NPDC050346]|uniref:hypothetical protein n=1 Tax=Polymorphospora sp. NPDC050346 TaxID=3155780 RepID=UPI0033EAF86D
MIEEAGRHAGHADVLLLSAFRGTQRRLLRLTVGSDRQLSTFRDTRRHDRVRRRVDPVVGDIDR